MDTFVTFQPSDYTDQITEDGNELTKRPYPLSFFLNGKIVDEDDFWQGNYDRIIGFQRDLAVMRVNVFWQELADAYKQTGDISVFEQTVGMYLVTQSRDHRMSVYMHAVSSFELYPSVPAVPAS